MFNASKSQVSHLAFVDDVIIFTNGVKSTLQKILTFLQEYEAIFGQRINQQKSCFITHKVVANSKRQIITQTTGFSHKYLPITYLGAPIYKEPRKVILFYDLVTKIQARIARWENKMLSPGGRITLLRSVLSSLPIYLLQVLKPLFVLLKKLNNYLIIFYGGFDKLQENSLGSLE